jgi:hypothetical protein
VVATVRVGQIVVAAQETVLSEEKLLRQKDTNFKWFELLLLLLLGSLDWWERGFGWVDEPVGAMSMQVAMGLELGCLASGKIVEKVRKSFLWLFGVERKKVLFLNSNNG